MKSYTLAQIEAELIGKRGTHRRKKYEQRIKLALFGELIRRVRLERALTQEQLGKLVGVQKSQISRLENGTSNMTIETIFKIFDSMKSDIHFEVRLDEKVAVTV